MSRVLLGAALLVGAGLAAYFWNRPEAPQEEPASITREVPASNSEVPLNVTAAASDATPLPTKDCASIARTLDSIDGLSLEELKQRLAPLGPFDEEVHWENTFYQRDGVKYTWHLVPAEAAEGRERWELKHYREDEDGPTLLEGKTFADKKTATAHRTKVLKGVGELEQKLSWNYGQDVTVTMTAAEHVRELRFSSPALQLDCDPTGCKCGAMDQAASP